MSKDSTEAVNGPKLAAEILKRMPKKDQERLATAIFREEPELYAKMHVHLTAKKAPPPSMAPVVKRAAMPKTVPAVSQPVPVPEVERENAIQDEEAQRRALDELLNSAPRPARKNGRYA